VGQGRSGQGPCTRWGVGEGGWNGGFGVCSAVWSGGPAPPPNGGGLMSGGGGEAGPPPVASVSEERLQSNVCSTRCLPTAALTSRPPYWP